MAELLDTLDSWEWEFWLAFASLEPFGPLREDLRAGEQVSAVFAGHGVRLAPEDVFPTLRLPRAKRAGGPGLAAALAHLCPALTPMPG